VRRLRLIAFNVCSQGRQTGPRHAPRTCAPCWPAPPPSPPASPRVSPRSSIEFDLADPGGHARAAGFAQVCEVAFGADLVARRYRDLLRENRAGRRF